MQYRAENDRDYCLSLTGEERKAQRCEARIVANGLALLVRVIVACPKTLCPVHAWLLRQPQGPPNPEVLPEGLRGEIAFDPDLRLAVMDDWGSRQPHAQPELTKVDLGTGHAEPFAPCRTPRLSPGGKWFLCCTAAKDVVRVPVNGGVPRVAMRYLIRTPTGAQPCPVEFGDNGLQTGVGSVPWQEEGPEAQPAAIEPTSYDSPLPLTERLRRCASWTPAERRRQIATLCGTDADFPPAVSADGRRIVTVRTSDICNKSRQRLAETFSRQPGGWNLQVGIQLKAWDGWGDPVPRTTQAQNRAAVERINVQLTQGAYRPAAIGRPSSPSLTLQLPNCQMGAAVGRASLDGDAYRKVDCWLQPGPSPKAQLEAVQPVTLLC